MLFITLFFLYANTLYLTRCDVSKSVPTLPLIESNITNDDVTEIQHATCRIATEELVATATATVSRVLTGACNAKTIDEKLKTMESNLTRKLEEIKTLLRTVVENRKDFKFSEASFDEKYSRMVNYDDDRYANDGSSPRQEEIDKFNGTVQEILNGATRIFFYYWQIKDFDEKLASWKVARSKRSSTFYVGNTGYAMYIKVTPKYFPDGTVFISVGLTRGRHDAALEWPFPFKIRLEILDHSPEQTRQDRRSRIWDPSTLCSDYFWGRPKLIGEPDNPECVGLSVSRRILFSKLPSSIDHPSRSTRYLRNGIITIKLSAYF